MMWSSLLLVPCLPWLAIASPTTFSLYGYGRGPLNGLPVFFADDLAYVGNVAPEGANITTNVTCECRDPWCVLASGR